MAVGIAVGSGKKVGVARAGTHTGKATPGEQGLSIQRKSGDCREVI